MRAPARSILGLLVFATLAACGDQSESAGQGGPGTAAEYTCAIRFAVTNETAFANLDALVDYGRAPGKFVGAGSRVDCTRLDDRITVYGANWNCDESAGCYAGRRPALLIQAFSNHDLATPVDLLECRFAAREIPSQHDFEVVQLNASNERYQPVDPAPVIAVADIRCGDTGTTTTSTTLPDPCADVSCAPGEACDRGDCEPVTGYEVDFVTPSELVQASASIADPPTRDREVRALREAMAELDHGEGTIVTLSEDEEIRVPEGTVRAVPLWRWTIERATAEPTGATTRTSGGTT